MRIVLIGVIIAAVFGSAAIVAVIVGNEGAAWRAAFAQRQTEYRAQRAERAAQAETERRAAELAAQQASAEPARPASPAFSPGFNPLNPLDPSGAQGATPAYDGPVRADLGNLPDSPGVEAVYYSCTACHSLDMVTQQHVTRARWDRLLTWMVAEQGMPDLGDDRAAVLDYLTRHFGAE